MKNLSVILVLMLLSSSNFAQPSISLAPVITGLSQPMQFVNAGDGSNRIFIPQKGGDIKVFDKDFVLLGTFLSITGIQTGGEGGLLSLCFHPQFKTNKLFFVFYTNISNDLEVARYQVGNSPDSINIARPSSKKVVIIIPHPSFTNHNGGTLRFGKDGFLYLSTGDGGSGGDPSNNAQNTNVLLGKMLRLNVNTSISPPYYTIPPTNPFGNEVLQYGLRNPFRWNFDRLTGDMWIGDVGQSAFEEINRCSRDSLIGVNYGWRCYEGNAVYNSTGCGNISNYKFPVYPYANPNVGSSVVGGTVYRGSIYNSMKGYYFGVDFNSGKLFKIKFDSLAYTYNISSQALSPNGITDFGETEDGEMYVTSLYTGNAYRVQSNDVVQYMFIGDGNWTDATNWSDNIIPPSNSLVNTIITIKPIIGGQCVVNTPISIPKTSKLIVENSKLLRMNSNLTFQ
jgi:glucose/arabinose dehydrogenase